MPYTSVEPPPVKATIALRATQAKFLGGSGGFRMTQPRACVEGDKSRVVASDPGRYNAPPPGAHSPRNVFFPADGPGDASARVQRERVKSGALLDTAPQYHMPPVIRPMSHDLTLKGTHNAFGVRTERWDNRPFRGPAPGSYDIPSFTDTPKPALGRSFAGLALTRASGPQGPIWLPVHQFAPEKPVLSPRTPRASPRKKVATTSSLRAEQAALRKAAAPPRPPSSPVDERPPTKEEEKAKTTNVRSATT